NLLSLLGESILELSQYYFHFRQKEFSEKIKLIKSAASVFKRDKKIEREAYCLKHLADLHHLCDSVDLAIVELKRALTLYKAIPNSHKQGVYDLLGVCYRLIGDHHSALKFGLLAEKEAEEWADSTMQLSTIYNRIGLTYMDAREDEKALRYFHKSHAVALRHLHNYESKYDVFQLYLIVCNIGNALNKLQRPEQSLQFIKNTIAKYPVPVDHEMQGNLKYIQLDSHIKLKQFTEAKSYTHQLLGMMDKIEVDDKLKNNIYQSAIWFFLETEQFSKAKYYLTAYKEIRTKARSPLNESVNELLWFKLDSALQNYPSAIAHYQTYKIIQDSLYNENRTKQIQLLQIEYETAKKDDEITLKAQSIDLLKKQTELQKNEIRQSVIVRNGTLAGILLLLIITGLLYNQYRIKQQANNEISHKNQTLQRLVDEKEWLLKEIHHRVKNNLQTIVSLLESQSAYLKNEALDAIRDSQNRVNTMSLIHQKLYQTDNVATINMAIFLPELVNYLKTSFDIAKRIYFNLKIEPIVLDVSQAVPVGLILNEAITNSIKYAFPEKTSNNEVSIMMNQDFKNQIILVISDNGIGLPENFQNERNNSLGLRLMKGLTDDISGEFLITTLKGTTIEITFTGSPLLHEEKKGISPSLLVSKI
ncbi:MAG TPA: sensor histidine kinase, partial [Chryseolinea sp.]|nr:sensor histidine kinase [Chryseolinea sp.]